MTTTLKLIGWLIGNNIHFICIGREFLIMFKINCNRNLQVSYLIVDEMHHDHPELLKDQYWDSVLTTELPHTVASLATREEPPVASTVS